MNIQSAFDFTELTTMKLPVVARYFVIAYSVDDVVKALEFTRKQSLTYIVIGSSSNIVWDSYIDAVVIHIHIVGIQWLEKDNYTIYADVSAGESWDGFVLQCCQQNYTGIEALSAIPGTVGATPVQNVGAYGVEVSDVIESVRVLDTETLSTETVYNNICDFGYRTSNFKTLWKQTYIILSVRFKLTKSQTVSIPQYPGVSNLITSSIANAMDIRNAIIELRSSKLPDPARCPNVGSFFKNSIVEKNQCQEIQKRFPTMPQFRTENSNYVKIPTGWLIEQCGFRGVWQGNFRCYLHNALVIEHNTHGHYSELCDFVIQIQQSVYDMFGIHITPEPDIISTVK